MSMIGRQAPHAIASTSDIADNAITSAKIAPDVLTAADIAPNAVTNSEMADDAVGVAELSATGTPNATSFLRGDNSWQIVDTEGTGIKSTGESGGDKFLREDGDGTSSWQVAGSPSIDDGGNATAMTIDSAEDVTFAKRAIIPSLKPASNQNLTGTYSDHEMIIGDQFTLTGDLTINDNLVLASLSGSGQDITITDDGNGRTITTAGRVLSCTTTNTDATVTTASTADLRAGKGVTGTGVPAGATIASVTNATTFELSAAATASGTVNLTFDTGIFEAGEFLGTVPPQTDISTMTSGTIASAITNNAGVASGAISDVVTFPSGFPIKVHHSYQTAGHTQNNATYRIIPGLSLNVATSTTSNKLLIQFNVGGYIDSGNDTVFTWRIYGDGVYIGYGTGTHGEATTAVFGVTYNNMPTGSWVGSLMYSPNTTSAKTYDVRTAIAFGTGVLWHPAPSSAITITEIVG